MENTNEITLVQKPVIQHKLTEVGISVTNRIKELNIDNLVANEDTVKSLKNLRVDLNKELTDYEAQRKALKEAVANPYMEFEAIYKTEISEKYKDAIEKLKDKIAVVEDKIKLEKKRNVVSYFTELCASENINFLKFENIGLEINLSTSEKQYKEKCNEFVQRVADDVLLINSQEHTAEIMVEYKSTLNASKAITAVVERKEKEKLEKERVKQAEFQKRQTAIRSLSMVYHDLTKSFNWVQDENVFVLYSDIEKMTDDEFKKLFIELEAKTKIEITPPAVTQATPVNEVVQAVLKPQPTQPLPAPTEVKEETKRLTAAFECYGTMAQLKSVGAFMKENNIEYKNI